MKDLVVDEIVFTNKILFTYYMPLLLELGETYESTWSYGETGTYRIVIDYGYQGGHGTGYAYFTIANIVYFTTQPSPYLWLNCTVVNNTDTTPIIIPPGYPFPWMNYTIMNDTGTYPVVIPSGYPWVTPLPVRYLEDG